MDGRCPGHVREPRHLVRHDSEDSGTEGELGGAGSAADAQNPRCSAGRPRLGIGGKSPRCVPHFWKVLKVRVLLTPLWLLTPFFCRFFRCQEGFVADRRNRVRTRDRKETEPKSAYSPVNGGFTAKQSRGLRVGSY